MKSEFLPRHRFDGFRRTILSCGVIPKQITCQRHASQCLSPRSFGTDFSKAEIILTLMLDLINSISIGLHTSLDARVKTSINSSICQK